MKASRTLGAKTLRRLQRFRAEALPASALRNQGAAGILDAARAFLKRVSLVRFRTRSRAAFAVHLDAVTERLKRRLPAGAQNWGAARKALNLFLRDCTYDHHLRGRYGLSQIEPWLEVPLDGDVATALRRTREGRQLCPWPGLKDLTPDQSAQDQRAAQRVADRKGLCRAHLDLYWWRERRRRKP